MDWHYSDYDGAWKDALDAYFPNFMALLWPDLHVRIDWNYKPVFLDKELQQIVRSAKRGRRHVDKLVRVHRLDGKAALVLIHVEIQGKLDKDFLLRMYQYHIRLREKYPSQPLVNLAVLLDQADGPPTHTYSYRQWGCTLSFSFPVVNLESWRFRMPELLELAPKSPFAVVLLAQLDAHATDADHVRLARKTELMRHLYEWGFSRDNVIQLFRIIDAMLSLPEALELSFGEAISQIEEDKQMTYVSSIERAFLKRERQEGRQEGLQKGLQEGLQKGASEILAALLTRKFGPLPQWAKARMAQADEASLNRWALQILEAQRIEDVFV